MSKHTEANTTKANEMNPPESSTAGFGVGLNMTIERVDIPREIIAPNHRRAYALAYVAGFNGDKLKFVSPLVKNSLYRGFLTGERDRQKVEADALDAWTEEQAIKEQEREAYYRELQYAEQVYAVAGARAEEADAMPF